MTQTAGTVIVGAGQAAIACASKLRSLDADMPITILGDEPHKPYQRPPLSKKYSTGEISQDRLMLKSDQWYLDHQVLCKTQSQVNAINPQAKSVTLSNGSALPYSHLVLATGSRPRLLPNAIGGHLKNVFPLRSIFDADAMRQAFAPGKRVLVIGGGYIGLEAAAVLNTLGMQVTIVEAASRILNRVASEMTSDFFRNLHQSKGVIIKEGLTLERLIADPSGAVASAKFSDASDMAVDFVLVGIGIQPNIELASQAGLVCEQGIKVDERGRTSDPNVFACGDCAWFKWQGRWLRLESVQNAIDQGELVAKQIAGQGEDYAPIPWFWSDQYDTKLQIAGLNTDFDAVIKREGKRKGGLSIWYFKEEQLLAVDAINDPQSYLVGKKLLETGRSVSPLAISEPATDLKALLKS